MIPRSQSNADAPAREPERDRLIQAINQALTWNACPSHDTGKNQIDRLTTQPSGPHGHKKRTGE